MKNVKSYMTNDSLLGGYPCRAPGDQWNLCSRAGVKQFGARMQVEAKTGFFWEMSV
jgi:hypothetical protein